MSYQQIAPNERYQHSVPATFVGVLQQCGELAAHLIGARGEHQPELGQQTAQLIDERDSLAYEFLR
jgi:hypothetical protein